MLEIENLHFRYSRRGPPVLNGVNLTLRDGEIGILLGKNGSGKTSLFKNILGILRPESGSIRFDKENLLKMNRRERARRVAYVPQSIQFGGLSVFDTVLMGRISYFGYKAGREDHKNCHLHITRGEAAAAHIRNGFEALQKEREQALIARNRATFHAHEAQNRIAIARLVEKIQNSVLLYLQPDSVRADAGELEAGRTWRALDLGDRFFFMKDGQILHAGNREVVTELVIQETFDAEVHIIEVEDKKIIINGGHKS